MKNSPFKNVFQTLYRDQSREHPQLEERINRHIIEMTKLSALVSLVFWPLMMVMGYLARTSKVQILILSFSFLALLGAISILKREHLRWSNFVACFWYLSFPGVIAYYVRTSIHGMKQAAQPFMIIRGSEEYLYFSYNDFDFVVGMFDRLVSINFFYAHIIIFVAMIPMKFKHVPAAIGLYFLYGLYAFSQHQFLQWMGAFVFVLVLSVAAKAVIEFLIVETLRKQLEQEAAFELMTKAVLDRDLELARDIQLSIPVPEKIVTELYEIDFYLKSHHLVGGDWLSVRQDGDNKFTILIVDAVGKGLQASLIIHAVQSLWTSTASTLDPEAWIRMVNSTLCEMGVKTPHCVTLGLIAIDDSVLTYWSAGHCPILMVGEKDGESIYQELTASGNMIGISQDLDLNPRTVDLRAKPFSQVVLCSDGLLSVLPRGRKRRDALTALSNDFHGTLNGLTADDDMTVVNIKLLSFRKNTKVA